MPLRRVSRGHDDRVLGRDPGLDRDPHHPVHVPGVGDVLRVAVVGAERDPAGPELLHERQQRAEVPRHRRLADEQPHPGAEPLPAFLDGQRLVVGADPGGRVRLELLAEQPGRVAVDVSGALEGELLELARGARDDAREVHHLGEPDDPPATHERLEVGRVERAERRLERRSGHA